MSDEQVDAFMQQLGIERHEEADFGWIAEVGLQSPLPTRWSSHTDEHSGCVYYVDNDRNASSWEHPLVPYLRRIVDIGRGFLQQPSQNFFEEQRGVLWHQHKLDLDMWHGPVLDDKGRQYFVNSDAGVSSWQDPRVEAQYIFELESGLLTGLQSVLPSHGPRLPTAESRAGEDARRTTNGVEFPTADRSPRARTPLGRGSADFQEIAKRALREDHSSTLERMTDMVDKMRLIRSEEHEAQRLTLAKKVATRRRRMAAAKDRSANTAIAAANAAAAITAAAAAAALPQRAPYGDIPHLQAGHRPQLDPHIAASSRLVAPS